MTDHEAMCPARRENWDDGSPFASPGECRCEEYARVRADERENGCPAMACPVRAARAEMERLRAHLATLKRLDDADTAEIDRLKEAVALRAEVAALTRWKDEATAVIEAWERVHALLGKPGFIGESKAEATWVEVRDLLDARSELAEIKRARREVDRGRA